MITYAVFVAVVVLALGIDGLRAARHRRIEDRSRRDEPAVEARPPDDLEQAERQLTAQRLAGDIDADAYRDKMVALARELGDCGVFEEARRAATIDRGLLVHAARVGTVAPELPLPMLTAVAGVVRYGAQDEDLVRMFGLTRTQAIKIMVFLHDETRPGT